jgi:hypothetical protein
MPCARIVKAVRGASSTPPSPHAGPAVRPWSQSLRGLLLFNEAVPEEISTSYVERSHLTLRQG